MIPLTSTLTPHRLYTFRCNGSARWMAVPYPAQYPSQQAEAQMLRTLFQTLEAEYPESDGTVMHLTHLGYVDQMEIGAEKQAGPEFAAYAAV